MGMFDWFGPDTSGIEKTAKTGAAKLDKSYDETEQKYDQAQDTLKQYSYEIPTSYLEQALPGWEYLTDASQQGLGSYMSLLGMGDADMQAELEKIPGYQFTVDQGLQALDRQAAREGNPYNATDVMDYMNGVASPNYFNYLNAYSPLLNLALPAQTGRSQAWGNLANTASAFGNNSANVDMALAKALNDITRQQVGLDTSAATALYNADAANWENIFNLGTNIATAGLGAPAGSVGDDLINRAIT